MFYGYEPLPLAPFIAALEIARSLIPNGRFLDVGCGIGTKLLLAHYLGWADVTGVELRPEYAGPARRLMPEATIVEADAFGWDGYNEFDVVYSYRLCVPDDLEIALEERIASLCRPGTLLILPMGLTKPGVSVAPDVWRV